MLQFSEFASVLAIAVALFTWARTQYIQRNVRRAEVLRELVGWFRSERDSSPELQKITAQFVYEPETWSFNADTDCATEKERALAKLLNILNHVAFHVAIDLIKAKDLSRTELGYYFGLLVDNASVEVYLDHIAHFDKTCGRRSDAGFYYFRHYAHVIADKAWPSRRIAPSRDVPCFTPDSDKPSP